MSQVAELQHKLFAVRTWKENSQANMEVGLSISLCGQLA